MKSFYDCKNILSQNPNILKGFDENLCHDNVLAIESSCQKSGKRLIWISRYQTNLHFRFYQNIGTEKAGLVSLAVGNQTVPWMKGRLCYSLRHTAASSLTSKTCLSASGHTRQIQAEQLQGNTGEFIPACTLSSVL